MRRRDFLGIAAGAALRPALVLAQPAKIPVIGFLNGEAPGPWAPYLEAFREGLSQTGYVEGQTVAIEFRWAEGRFERLPAQAAELVRRKVDILVTSGSARSAPAAKNATSTIPIVFITGVDPVAEGLVASLARPGGNITGFAILASELMEKRLDLISELVPRAKSVALLVNPSNPNSRTLAESLPRATGAKGLQLHVVKASTEREIDAVFASLAQVQAGALLAGSDAFFNNRREQLVTLAARYAVPAIYDDSQFTKLGGLMTYGPSVAEGYRQLGIYAGKVLHGANPADLPVQQPTKFELVINLKTAQALGLTVPQSLLARADEVIE